jgi:hypothetical protein
MIIELPVLDTGVQSKILQNKLQQANLTFA